MTEYRIDCALLDSPRALHEALAQALGFPRDYGQNLDALHDCLTSLPVPVKLVLTGFDALPFRRGFQAVFRDSMAENPGLMVEYC